MKEKEFREWFDSIPEDKAFNAKIAFASSVEKTMKDDGVSKAELARRLNVKPARITKILSGEANLTIESMVDIAVALGSMLYPQIEKDISDVKWNGIAQEKTYYTEAWKVIDNAKEKARNGLFVAA